MEKEVLEARLKQARANHQALLQEAFRLEGEIRYIIRELKGPAEKEESKQANDN